MASALLPGTYMEPLPEFEGLIGRSAGMRTLFDHIRRVAPYDAPVLIFGETDTDKERVASAVHRLSCRHAARFEAVNGGALTRELLRSELFGHERGASRYVVALDPGVLVLVEQETADPTRSADEVPGEGSGGPPIHDSADFRIRKAIESPR